MATSITLDFQIYAIWQTSMNFRRQLLEAHKRVFAPGGCPLHPPHKYFNKAVRPIEVLQRPSPAPIRTARKAAAPKK